MTVVVAEPFPGQDGAAAAHVKRNWVWLSNQMCDCSRHPHIVNSCRLMSKWPILCRVGL